MPRLVNAPLPISHLAMRKRVVRSYCQMLYGWACERLSERLERAAHAEQRAQLKAVFERDAAMLQRRVPFPAVRGEIHYRITIRNPVTGETHEAFFRPTTTYGSFFHTVRETFNQPVQKNIRVHATLA